MTRSIKIAVIGALAGSVAAANDLKICVEGAYPPYSQMSDSGEVVGFDIDIANALCDEMGRNCEMVVTEWDAIIPALEEGKCDAIVASMSITEERKQRIDFSERYYQVPARFAAAKGAGFTDDDEGLAGARVCVQRGTIHQDYLEAKFPSVDLALYPTQDEVHLDLATGRCDAILADSIAIQDGFLSTEDGQGFAFFGGDHTDPEYFGEGAGIGVRKSDTELRDALSAAIRAIRGNGVYEEINNRYFAFDIYGG